MAISGDSGGSCFGKFGEEQKIIDILYRTPLTMAVLPNTKKSQCKKTGLKM